MLDPDESNEFEEGCVKITFEPSGRKQCVTYVIDFGKTKLDTHKAGGIIKKITEILRSGLGLSLKEFT